MGDNDLSLLWVTLGDDPPKRLDKALAQALPADLGLSRSRVTALIRDGAIREAAGSLVTDPTAKPIAGARYAITLPDPEDIAAKPQAIPLDIVHEDADLLVVNKPAGLVVHPGAGTPDGTLVNALLHHCGADLSGIGGARRPGIVHRLDKDTSGLLVVAKTDAAHQGLARQFAAHDVDRVYEALCWGLPSVADPKIAARPGVSVGPAGTLRIDQPIGRDPRDRVKMAVVAGGRHAVTHVTTEERLGQVATAISCQLETGRTHQIRVHLAHIGHPLIGDPHYATGRTVPAHLPNPAAAALKKFTRQALHAGALGFRHPILNRDISFKILPPADYQNLRKTLALLET